MKPLKILHVIASMNPEEGGVCKAVRMIIAGLTPLGMSNEVVTYDVPGSHYLGGDAFAIHALGPAKNPWNYGNKLMPWLGINLRRFDVVILHGLWLYNGYALNKAIKQVRQTAGGDNAAPNYYVMPHGMLDPYFQLAETRKIKAIRNQIYWKLVERKVVNEAAGLLFTCEEERRLAHKSFSPYVPKQELVIGLGIEEPPAFVPEMRKSFLEKCIGLGNDPYILFLGRIHEKKGVDLLINAYKELAGNYSLPKLVIAGPNGDSEYGRQMQSLVNADHLLREKINFSGMLSGYAKWGAVYGCEAFVLPSHQENFGIAVVEALACGKPVLISDHINIWREINEADAGLVSETSLAKTKEMIINWIKLSVTKRTLMGMQARSCFENFFEINVSTALLANVVQTKDSNENKNY